MGAVPITIVGIETKDDGSSGQVTIVGMASLTGLSVGGGPIVPPDQPPGKPTFPIWGPPGIELPPSPGYPPVAGHPLPPIPPPIDVPPGTPPGTVLKPPPESGGWGWVVPYGWGFFPASDAAGPKG